MLTEPTKSTIEFAKNKVAEYNNSHPKIYGDAEHWIYLDEWDLVIWDFEYERHATLYPVKHDDETDTDNGFDLL